MLSELYECRLFRNYTARAQLLPLIRGVFIFFAGYGIHLLCTARMMGMCWRARVSVCGTSASHDEPARSMHLPDLLPVAVRMCACRMAGC